MISMSSYLPKFEISIEPGFPLYLGAVYGNDSSLGFSTSISTPPHPLPAPPPLLLQEGNLFSLGELEGGGQPCSYRKY